MFGQKQQQRTPIVAGFIFLPAHNLLLAAEGLYLYDAPFFLFTVSAISRLNEIAAFAYSSVAPLPVKFAAGRTPASQGRSAPPLHMLTWKRLHCALLLSQHTLAKFSLFIHAHKHTHRACNATFQLGLSRTIPSIGTTKKCVKYWWIPSGVSLL